MRNCWLISEIGAGVPRANNELELCNGHVKHSFTENLVQLINESLRTFITWATSESRLHTSLCTHELTEHISGKNDVKVIGQVHSVWREDQKKSFQFYQRNWHVLNSGFSRRTFLDVDVNVCMRVLSTHTMMKVLILKFPDFHAPMRLT